MKIEKITYSQSHETISHSGLRTWYKFEAGGTVDQGENMEEAVATLKKFVQENVFPDLGMANEYAGGNGKPAPDPKDHRIQAFIDDINSCDTIDKTNHLNIQTGLLAYESAANSDPRIKAAYDLKMIQLKQK